MDGKQSTTVSLQMYKKGYFYIACVLWHSSFPWLDSGLLLTRYAVQMNEESYEAIQNQNHDVPAFSLRNFRQALDKHYTDVLKLKLDLVKIKG